MSDETLYRVHWHDIETGYGYMSAPMTLDKVEAYSESIRMDDTVEYDGYFLDTETAE